MTTVFWLAALGVAAGQEEDPGLAEGRAVYERRCAACHQIDGSGVPGTFPPLLDNPSILDADYLRSVIVEGLEGEIEVLGVIYDSRMIAFPNLDPGELSALVAFIQESWSPQVPSTSTTTTTTTTGDDPATPSDRQIADGRLIYEANCAACHGSDGAGRSGIFPPLLNNPGVDDTEYLQTVVRAGLTGEIEVLGETYDGNMPAFRWLDDDELAALTAYVQAGLGAPVVTPPPISDPGGTAGTSLPSGAALLYRLGFLVALGGAAIVLTPVVLARADGGTFTPVQTWLKSAAIVLYFVIATVIIPSKVMESGLLATPPSVYQDLISADLWDIIRSLIGTTVWLVTLGGGLWGLRRIQRNKVI